MATKWSGVFSIVTKPFSSLLTGRVCAASFDAPRAFRVTILADARLVTFEGWAVAELEVFDSALRERVLGAIWDRDQLRSGRRLSQRLSEGLMCA
jgi:hypothetical protein